jgi:DNA-binding FrmR family transcriptional regulator
MHTNPDALLVALVLAPGTFSRNRHFHLFEQGALKRARRRAGELRGIVRDLTEPWHNAGGRPLPGPDQVEEREIEGEIHLEYRMLALDFRRRAVLSKLEAAAVHYALAQAGRRVLSDDDRRQVESVLLDLDPSRSV